MKARQMRLVHRYEIWRSNDSRASFSGTHEDILDATDVNGIHNSLKDILKSMACFEMQGSNWRFKRCLIGYSRIEELNKHIKSCSQNNVQGIELPELGTIISSRNNNRSMRLPFIVYATLESFLKLINTWQML